LARGIKMTSSPVIDNRIDVHRSIDDRSLVRTQTAVHDDRTG
jgi:hypothetical protein